MHIRVPRIPLPGAWPAAWRRVVLWSMPVATIAGFVAHRAWRAAPAERMLELLSIAAIATGFAWVLHRAGRVHWPWAMAAAWSAGLVAHAGAGPVVAMLLVFAAAIGIGTLFAGTRGAGQRWLALPAGLEMACGVAGWWLAFPVHHAATYAGICGVIVALRWRAIASVSIACARGMTAAFDAAPRAAGFAITIVGLVSTAAWVPTMQVDDLGYHLGLGWELQALGYSRLDPETSVWALAPWMGDLLQGFVQVLAGSEGRGAVNAGWLVLCCIGTWHLCRLLRVPVAVRWIGISAFASIPLLYAQVAGMQTELASAAMALALAVALVRQSDPLRRIALIAVLAAGVLALKVSNGLLLLPMALWMLARMRVGGCNAWRTVLRAVVLGVIVGGACYAQAWWFAGNPVLPWLNGVFGSPFFLQETWMDRGWHAGDWRLPWTLMFASSRFVEAADGATGMLVLLALAGALLAMWVRRARVVALIGLTGCVLSFAAIEYVRYLLPAFAVLWPAALAGLAQLRMPRATSAAVASLALLNASLLATGFWSLRDGLLRHTLLQGRDAATARFAPHRALAQLLRERYPDGQVMLVDGYHLAERAGRAYSASWFDHALVREAVAADADPTGATWRRLWTQLEVDLVASQAQPSPAMGAALASLRATRVAAAGAMNLWEIPRVSLPSTIVAGAQPGHWAIRIAIPDGARRMTTRVAFACDAPDAPIATAWGFRRTRDDAVRDVHWDWATCRSDGTAELAQALPVHADARELQIVAEPVRPIAISVRQVDAHAGKERERRDRAAAFRRRILDAFDVARPEATP